MQTPKNLMVLSHYQTKPLRAARQAHQLSARISLDLNLTLSDVMIEPDTVILSDSQRLDWQTIEHINTAENSCFLIEDGRATKIQAYSEQTDRHYSLYPTALAPTMLISGLPMHRIKDTDPYHDTLAKIRAASLTRRRTLDTATGLGYTAIEAAKVADEVITIELDPAAQEVARLNPWSQALFDNPKIKQIIGDSYDEVTRFESASFSRIIHDPPTFSLAGDLYSAEFYRELYRILKPGGRLFHYVGDLNSSLGSRISRGAMERLRRVGFRQVTPRPEAFGLVARK